MGILDKVLHHNDEDDQPQLAPEATEAECPHTAMAPHWDNLGDMGKSELAVYTCESCGRTFSYEQSQQFMETPPAPVLAATGDVETHDYSGS